MSTRKQHNSLIFIELSRVAYFKNRSNSESPFICASLNAQTNPVIIACSSSDLTQAQHEVSEQQP
jgi:hypothetical protein